MNQVTLIGRLGHDPEVKAVGEVKVASLSLATTTKWKNSDGTKVERTEWHRLVMWRGLAEIAEKYLEKGSQIAVSGEIRYRSYTDKDGVERKVTEINVDKMEMLGSSKEKQDREPRPVEFGNTPRLNGDMANQFNESQDAGDDLPF